LADDGWDALVRTTGLKVLAISVNSIGTLILLGGLLYSVYRFRTTGTHRNRMLGCLLIAGGTLAVASGGTATRLGSDGFLYVAMSAGITLIFSGYLLARRPDSLVEAADGPVAETGIASVQPIRPVDTSPIAFIEHLLGTLDDPALAHECRVWSVPNREIEAFSRAEARRVWAFRSRLSEAGQGAFDVRPAAIRLQLTEFHFDVQMADTAAADRPQIAPLERLPIRDGAEPESRSKAAGSVD
jgi:hypothetical protein